MNWNLWCCLSWCVCVGGSSPLVPDYERKPPPVMTFSTPTPHPPIASLLKPLCPTHALAVIPFSQWSPVRVCRSPDQSASGCLRDISVASFCFCFLNPSFARRTSSSVFQLNVQIVNNNCSLIVPFCPCLSWRTTFTKGFLQKQKKKKQNKKNLILWSIIVGLMKSSDCWSSRRSVSHWWVLFFLKWL